jgi:hypothetical protein
LLVLFSRILAVSFLVLAFAQPYIPVEQGNKIVSDRAVSVFIDNSFSMEAVTREGSLLDVAKNKAREIAAAYKQSDRFQLLTNDFDPVHQRLISREEFIDQLEQVRISPSSRQLSEVISRQKDALVNAGSSEINSFLISDFQESITDLEAVKQDSLLPVILIPVSAGEVANLYIDSCWFSSPVVQIGQPVELNVRIRNYGESGMEAVGVKLVINGIQKSVATVDLSSFGYADARMTFTLNSAGWQRAEVSITDDPVTFDDSYFFSFKISSELNILSLNNEKPNPYLMVLFGQDRYFRISNSDQRQIDYSLFQKQSLIIMNELKEISSGFTAEIKKYVDDGGSLLIIPDSASDLLSYSAFLNGIGADPFTAIVENEEKVVKIALEDPLFTGVFSDGSKVDESSDFPIVRKYFSQSVSSSSRREMLMQLRSGSPLLSRYKAGNGVIYIFSVPLNSSFSNLARHALFVPVLYRIALLSEKPSSLAYMIGRDDRIEIPGIQLSGDNVFHLVSEEKKFDIIPAHKTIGSETVLSVNGIIREAGIYELKTRNEPVSSLSFNYNRKESMLKFRGEEQLISSLEELKLNNFKVMAEKSVPLVKSLSVMNEGIRLWKYCIIMVLLFLAFEILLLKFLKQ